MLLIYFSDLENADMLNPDRRVVRIVTSDLPQYFALVTRIKQESRNVGADGLVISSTVSPQVQAMFPPGSLTKTISVGLQVIHVVSELEIWRGCKMTRRKRRIVTTGDFNWTARDTGGGQLRPPFMCVHSKFRLD